jgi:ABC-type glycerol-3-phosphate transport system substrate-binding protein
MKRRYLLLGLLVLFLPLLVAACGGDDEEAAPPVGEETGAAETGAATEEAGGAVSGDVSVMAVWTGPEQEAFQAVLDGFTEANPDVSVNYTSAGDQLPTQLATAVEGGNPPDVAVLPQPGLMADFASKGALQPLDFAQDAIAENLGESAVELGSVDGTLYGFLYKAANKSTVWYNVQAFEEAGVEPPETWEDFLAAAETLNASGLPAYSIGGADGWTLTDLFENIYLRTAGPDTYDQLSRHEIPWTDQSVKDALAEMAKVVGDTDNIAGGQDGALQTDFPTSVSNVFSASPKAAIVIEGDFVPGVVPDSGLEPETGFDVFAFPSINDSPPAVVGGGDTVVMFTDSPAAQALIEYLATAEAAQIWAERGGFASLNKGLDASVFPDAITQVTAGAIAEAETFRFDLSDLQPAEFGGTVGQGLFKLFQDFLANPDNIDGITQQMEDAAAKAFG